MSLLQPLLYRLMRAATAPLVWRVERFQRDCERPEQIQKALLFEIVRRQSATAFGRDHGFASIRTIADYRRQVPIAPYERLAPYIERVKNGETDALLADDAVRLFALTSGTTAARKFIPITDRYLTAYRRSWSMWGIRTYRDHRARRLGLRPIVQMGGDPDEFRTPSGIACGNLSGFTATVQKRMVRRLYCVPPETGTLKEPLARYYLALRMSIGLPVALFLAANPSTMLMFGRTLDREREHLLKDLHDGTLRPDLEVPAAVRTTLAARLKPNPNAARLLGAIAEKRGRLYPRDVWPEDTTLMGTWTGGSMGPYLRQIPALFGDLPIRDLGLVASEGRMTIPFANNTSAGVLDIGSHYFEFVPESEIDSSQPQVLGAHELEEDRSYYIVPTTAAGLYRYHISDLVRVRGFLGRTPMVEFLGKGHRFANMTGEKLSEPQVTQAMEAATRRTGYAITAYSVAPIWHETTPYYGLFIEECDTRDEPGLRLFLAAFDQALIEQNVEYEAKRHSGRLEGIRAEIIVTGTWQTWDRDRLAATGGSPEQYKHPCLIGDLAFRTTLPVLREVLRV